MLHFAFAKIVQMGTPPPILFKIIGHTLGKQNVTGIATIHHPLGDVDTGSRYIGAIIHVGSPAYRTAVDSHAHPQFRMGVRSALLISIAQETGASGVVAKDQRHSVAGRQARQFASKASAVWNESVSPGQLR